MAGYPVYSKLHVVNPRKDRFSEMIEWCGNWNKETYTTAQLVSNFKRKGHFRYHNATYTTGKVGVLTTLFNR